MRSCHRVPPPARCLADDFYEDNDNRTQACPVVAGQTYIAHTDDREDIFYFVLTETTSVQIEVNDYQAGEPGQLLIYDDFDNTRSMAAERYLMGYGGIPNEDYRQGGEGLLGKYYIRIYTYPDAFRPDTTYSIRFLPR